MEKLKFLFEDWNNARDYYMQYAMKATYGDIRDRVYNIELAMIWSKIILNIREKIVLANQNL